MGNLDIWNTLGRTDPDQTKQFQRGGGFKGTAVKPIYTTQKMTETFGPAGIGWGVTEPQFQVVPGDNKEVLVYCWLSLWIERDGKRSELIPGVGGDKVVSHIKANPQYNRPERWENDDEAFKKAFTDAIGNAMKHLGMSADVHMGLFDDSKYVAQRRREEAEEGAPPQAREAKTFEPAPEAPSITRAQQEDGRRLVTAITACETIADLDATKRQPEFIGAFKVLPVALKTQVNDAGKAHHEKLLAAQPVLMAGE